MADTFTFEDNSNQVIIDTKVRASQALFRMAAYVRKAARNSIKTKNLRKTRKKRKNPRQYQSEEARQNAIRHMRMKKRIGKNPTASEKGTAPHTRKGRIRRAILFEVERDNLRAYVGTAFSRFATVGKAHEYGGKFRGNEYPARPFMRPAIEKNKKNLTKILADYL